MALQTVQRVARRERYNSTGLDVQANILKPNWFSDVDASALANAEASDEIKI